MKNKAIALAVVTLFLATLAVAAPGPRAVCYKEAGTANKEAVKACRTMPAKTKEEKKAKIVCFKNARVAFAKAKKECRKQPVRAPKVKTDSTQPTKGK